MPAYYAGSLLQMDFGEAGEEKSFVVVTASPGKSGKRAKPAKIEHIPYEGGLPLVDLRASLAELEQIADRYRTGWLRVTVPLTERDPDLNRKVRELLPNALVVRAGFPRPRSRRTSGGRPGCRLRDTTPPIIATPTSRNRTSSSWRSSGTSMTRLPWTIEALRPVHLTVEGLACFREKQEIDFRALELFAISGPTGAGKSTLLDAVIFALYGEIPRVHHQNRTEMISAARNRVSVVLDFDVGPRRYRIARMLRRSGVQMVRLEEQDETGSFKSLADQVRAATDQVVQILGLEATAFMQAVILPQGEFARFLKAQPRERRSMLRTLLRLDVYERMRERAQRLAALKKGTVDSLTSSWPTNTPGSMKRRSPSWRESMPGSSSRSKSRERDGPSLRRRSPGCAAGTRRRLSCGGRGEAGGAGEAG